MSKKRILKVIFEDILEEIDRIKKFTQGIEKYHNLTENKQVLMLF